MATKYPQWLSAAVGQTWKDMRPYKALSDYDVYYLDLAKELFFLLEASPLTSEVPSTPEQLAELASAMAGYFEDFVSEIGLWKAFTDRHLEVTGAYLPFLDLEDYDPDYINWQDVNLLVWIWANNVRKGKFMSPVSDFLEILSMDIVEFLEEAIEDAPATAFFDEWLQIKDDANWMQIRPRIEWLATDSYLFGLLDCKYWVAARMKAIAADNSNLLSSYGGELAYDAMLDFTFTEVSRIGGLRMPEMARRILKGSPDMLASIANASTKVQGLYRWKGTTGAQYQLQHKDSGRLLDVEKISADLYEKDGRDVLTSLVKWRDQYWFTGMLVQLPETKEKFHPQPVVPYFLQSNAEKAETEDFLADQEAAFLETFDRRLVLLPDRIAATAGLGKYYAAAELRNAKKAGRKPEAPDAEFLGMLKQFDLNEPMGIFFHPGVGLMFTPEVPIIVAFLEGKKLAGPDAKSVFFTLYGKLPFPLVEYILAHYPTARLQLEGIGFDTVANAVALSWFLNPSGWAKAQPMIGITGEGTRRG